MDWARNWSVRPKEKKAQWAEKHTSVRHLEEISPLISLGLDREQILGPQT